MLFSSFYSKKGLREFCCKRGLRLVCVSRSCLSGFNGIVKAEEVFPSWEMIRLVKDCKDYRGYKRRYWEEVLKKVDCGEFVRKYDNSVLLCWERDYKCCHRYLLGEWILSNGFNFGGELEF